MGPRFGFGHFFTTRRLEQRRQIEVGLVSQLVPPAMVSDHLGEGVKERVALHRRQDGIVGNRRAVGDQALRAMVHLKALAPVDDRSKQRTGGD